MKKLVAASHLLERIPGPIYLWLAVTIFAAASSVTQKLTKLGAQNLIDGRNPISFCNVLFMGNLCALLVLVCIFWRQLNIRSWRQFSLQDWSSMAAVALLSGAIAPGTFFEALSRTAVNNVILVGRIEPPLTLALSIWLLGESANFWEITGAIVAFVGVVVMLVLQGLWDNNATSGFSIIGWGEILTAIGAVAVAVSSIISKTRLGQIPVGFFTIFRTALGTIIFFFAALYLYGSDHFLDVFSPFLWKWMLAYGTIIVVIGQYCWLTGLKNTSASDASLAGAFNPVAAVVAAYLILGEVPTPALYIGGGVTLFGIALNQIGVRRRSHPTTATTNRASHPQGGETGVGFKGL
jgi:drug/metabolite transporter (DMT)-like permease